MAVLTVTKSYDDGQVLTESMLDDIKNSLETWANVSKLDGTNNIQDSGIITANLADGILSADATGRLKMADTFVNAAKLASDAVTTAKIIDGALSADATGRAKMADGFVDSNKLAANSVTAGKIAAGAITRSSLESVGQQISSSCSTSYSNSTGTPTDVTNLSVTITTSGRPVMIFCQTDGANDARWGIQRSSESAFGRIHLLRDGSEIARVFPGISDTGSGATTSQINVPPNAVTYLDTPAAGTYTYKIQASTTVSSTIFAISMVLVAFEL